jgi:hypothetical protein
MDTTKQAAISNVHPYLQRQLELTLSPVTRTYKFVMGAEIRHVKSGGVYIITGLPNEYVIEATREAAYAYLMPDGRICIRSQTEMEDGRFEEAEEGAAMTWVTTPGNYDEWLKKSQESNTSVAAAEVKPRKIEAIWFNDFVEHGKRVAETLVDGVPWAFSFRGHPITHETDSAYVIPNALLRAAGQALFKAGEVLLISDSNELVPCDFQTFAAILSQTAALVTFVKS